VKFRYYVNDAGDIMSGVFGADKDRASGVSDEELPFFDDPDLDCAVVEVSDDEHNAMTYVPDMIRTGLVENDQLLTRFLLNFGVLV
jgi:hypothetical protein